MKTKERLAYMALGGILVIAGMILGQFMFSSVYAQKELSTSTQFSDQALNPVFETIRCNRLIIGDEINSESVDISTYKGSGVIRTYNGKKGMMIDTFPDDFGHGSLLIFNGSSPYPRSEGKNGLRLGVSKNGGVLKAYNNDGEEIGYFGSNTERNGIFVLSNAKGESSLEFNSSNGATMRLFNSRGSNILYMGASNDDDGLIVLKDRHGDAGWGQSGKVE